MSDISLPFLNPNDEPDFWVCYAKVDSRRPFFFPLIKEDLIINDSREEPWFSFVSTKPYKAQKVDLLDFSNFTENGDTHSPFAYYNGTYQKIELTNNIIATENGQELKEGKLYITVKHGKAKLNGLKLELSRISESVALSITLSLLYEGDIYKCNIRIFRSNDPANESGIAALDFGSEASQYGFIHENTESTGITEKDIFTSFQQLYGEPAGNLPDYWQQDYYSARNPRFLRTRIFFSQNKYDNIKSHNRFLSGNESLVYLKKIAAQDAEVYLPNLKLLMNNNDAAGNISIKTVSNNSYYCNNSVINAKDGFWKLYFSVMRTYIEALINEASQEKKYWRIKILLPNIISQQNIQQILFYLHKEVEQNILNQKIDGKKKYPGFEGFELECMPESDANVLSFLNAKDDINLKRQEYVLSLDCGNGTTDLGIYDIDDKSQKINRILRTGVAAAGNYLTFSVAIGLLDHFIVKENQQDFRKKIYEEFFKELSQQSQDEKDKLWQILHDIKKLYSVNSYLPNLTFQGNSPQSRVKDLLDSLKVSTNPVNGEQGRNIHAATVDAFADQLVRQVLAPVWKIHDRPSSYGFNDFNIQHLMISGRGSIFTPYLQSLINQVRTTCTKNGKLWLHLPGKVQIEVNENTNISSLIDSGQLSSSDFKSASITGLKSSDRILDRGFLDYLVGTSLDADPGHRFTLKFPGSSKKQRGGHSAFQFDPFKQDSVYMNGNSNFLEGAMMTTPKPPLKKGASHFAQFNGFNYGFYVADEGSKRTNTQHIDPNQDKNSFRAGLRMVSLCPFFIKEKTNQLADFVEYVRSQNKTIS